MKLICTLLAAGLLAGCSEKPAQVATTDRTKHEAQALMEVKKKLQYLNENLADPLYARPEDQLRRLLAFKRDITEILFPPPVLPPPEAKAVLVRGFVQAKKESGLAVIFCEESGTGVFLRDGVYIQRGACGLRDGEHLQVGQAVSVWASGPEAVYYTNRAGIHKGIDYLKHVPAD